jgi:hypothetical protein
VEVTEDFSRKARVWTYSTGVNWPSPGFVNSNTKWEADISTRRVTNTIPKYQQLIASHVDASSHYMRTWTSVEILQSLHAEAQVHSSTDGHINRRYADGNPETGTATTFLQKQSVRALSNYSRNLLNVKFLNTVQATYQSLDGSTFIGEFGETLHGLLNPAKALRSGLAVYLNTLTRRAKVLQKQRNRSLRIKAMSDMVTGTYLEFRFGWLPLINDINDAGRALNELVDGFGFTVKSCSASISEVDYSASGPGGQVQSPDGLFSWSTYNEVEEHITARMYGIVKREISRPYTFQEQLGLTPENWLPAVWNVLPYSFVADYFVNIGNCLSAGGTCTRDLMTLGLTTRNSRTRITRTTKLLTTVNQLTANGYVGDSISSSMSAFKYVSGGIERQVLDPGVDLWVTPVINLPTSSVKWTNLAALATQMAAASRLMLS